MGRIDIVSSKQQLADVCQLIQQVWPHRGAEYQDCVLPEPMCFISSQGDVLDETNDSTVQGHESLYVVKRSNEPIPYTIKFADRPQVDITLPGIGVPVQYIFRHCEIVTGFSADQFRINHAGRQLDRWLRLMDEDLQKGSTINAFYQDLLVDDTVAYSLNMSTITKFGLWNLLLLRLHHDRAVGNMACLFVHDSELIVSQFQSIHHSHIP